MHNTLPELLLPLGHCRACGLRRYRRYLPTQPAALLSAHPRLLLVLMLLQLLQVR